MVRALRADLEASAGDWENSTLERYLDALAAWTEDSAGYYESRGEPTPDLDWSAFADALAAAKSYE
ncbi:MAG: hypothetical protein JWR63_1995 [Conexibacter sp.]|nr:hypothetical protein [Conexibacter sp.]